MEIQGKRCLAKIQDVHPDKRLFFNRSTRWITEGGARICRLEPVAAREPTVVHWNNQGLEEKQLTKQELYAAIQPILELEEKPDRLDNTLEKG